MPVKDRGKNINNKTLLEKKNRNLRKFTSHFQAHQN